MQNTNDCINLGHFGPFSGGFTCIRPWVVHVPGRVSVCVLRGHVARASFRSFEISGVSCRVRSPCCMSPAFRGSMLHLVSGPGPRRDFWPCPCRGRSVAGYPVPAGFVQSRGPLARSVCVQCSGALSWPGPFGRSGIPGKAANMPTVARFRPFGAISAYFRISGRISARGEIWPISGPFAGVRSGACFNC